MTVNTILIALLISGILIALILNALSKFLPQSETPKIEELVQFSANMQQIKDGVDELRKIFAPAEKNNRKRPTILVEVAEIKRILSEWKSSEQSLPVNEGDRQSLSQRFDEINAQIGSLNEITHKIDDRSDRSAELMESQEKIRKQLDEMQAAFKQTWDEDEQFLEGLSSKLVPQIEAKLNPISLDQGQMNQISQMMNTSYGDFLQVLEDLLNAQGYKKCKKCRDAAVPKDANFCHNCGKEFDSANSSSA